MAIARAAGWRVHAERTALTASGRYSTPIQGDAGFPDLVMVRGRHLWFVELKRKPNTVEPDQHLWLATLDEFTSTDSYGFNVATLVVWVPEQQQAFLEQICSRHPNPDPFIYSPTQEKQS